MRAAWAIAVAMVLSAGASADAQHVSLDLRDGKVTLDARDVSLDEVLTEWTRTGGTRIVRVRDGAIVAPRLTLLLRDITEREALDIVLRSVSGYLLVGRRDGFAGLSAFEQILLLPTSSPQLGPAPADAAAPRGGDTIALPRPARLPAQVAVAEADLAGDAAASTDSVGEPAIGGNLESDDVRRESPSGARADGTRYPPTPLLPPSEAPDAQNPFGKVAGTARPGAIAPSGPPPGVVYPPVTNPNLESRPAPNPER